MPPETRTTLISNIELKSLKVTHVHPLIRGLIPSTTKSLPMGGRLKIIIPQWGKLTKDPLILELIRGNKIPLLGTPHQTMIPKQLGMTREQKLIVSKEVENMLEMGVWFNRQTM